MRMKTPVSYYGGKQKLVDKIISLIPQHTLYCEPFLGGAAVLFAKKPSNVEVINDTNRELINFYHVVRGDFDALEKQIQLSLHSRDQYRQASVIYNHPDMFSPVKRAWAVWMLTSQGFSAMLDSSWGFDISKNTTTLRIKRKKKTLQGKWRSGCRTAKLKQLMRYTLLGAGIVRKASFIVILRIIIRTVGITTDIAWKISKACCSC